MNKFLLFSILLLVGCHEQTTKQQEKQVENSYKLKILESFADDVCIGNKNFE